MTKEEMLELREMMESVVAPLKQELMETKNELRAEIQESENRMITKFEAVKVELKSDIAEVKEDAEITRTSVNHLLDWAEKTSTMVKVPLYEKAE